MFLPGFGWAPRAQRHGGFWRVPMRLALFRTGGRGQSSGEEGTQTKVRLSGRAQMWATPGQRLPWKTWFVNVVNSEICLKQQQQEDTGNITWWEWPGESCCGSSFVFLYILLGLKELHSGLLVLSSGSAEAGPASGTSPSQLIAASTRESRSAPALHRFRLHGGSTGVHVSAHLPGGAEWARCLVSITAHHNTASDSRHALVCCELAVAWWAVTPDLSPAPRSCTCRCYRPRRPLTWCYFQSGAF